MFVNVSDNPKSPGVFAFRIAETCTTPASGREVSSAGALRLALGPPSSGRLLSIGA